jgi:hypothetical protein
VLTRAASTERYSDSCSGHPFIQGERRKEIGALAQKGVGLGLIHWSVEVPKESGGSEFLEWIGGYYEGEFSCNPTWKPDYQKFPDYPG